MISSRSLLSPFLETHLASPIRHMLAVHRAHRDDAGTRLSAKLRNVSVLEDTDSLVPAGQSRSGELFLLGSGPSALQLTPANLRRMKAGTTIGLNSWALHDFIPDAYSFEEIENDDYIPIASGLSLALARNEVIRAQPLILHLRSRLSTPSRRLIGMPPELHHRIRYYGRVNVETRKAQNLEADLKAILNAQLKGTIPANVLIDSGMSIARMISLGMLRGFHSIILVGVDLKTSRYFFEEDPSFLLRHNLTNFNPAISRKTHHDTEELASRHFAASVFLPAFARVAQTTMGIKVYVGSRDSKLATHLELFQW